jgi:nucleotide-binding universal stress UspA family protein
VKKILVAYDGGVHARRALEKAADFALAGGGAVTVISVVPERLGLRLTIDPFDDEKVHADYLDEAAGFLQRRGLTAETLQPKGDPAHVIEKVARQGGYDMIVLGSRGRGTASRLLLGSVSAHVAARAKADVVIVH